ncbi:MAG: hypothetical protein H7A32_00025 [Deltaproteobacteria bacterium]|nr:hypothetical protein [Deltaproteobacteria bacterium]
MNKNIPNGVFQSLLSGNCAEFTFVKQNQNPADANLAKSLNTFSQGNPTEVHIRDQVTIAPNQDLEKIRKGHNKT